MACRLGSVFPYSIVQTITVGQHFGTSHSKKSLMMTLLVTILFYIPGKSLPKVSILGITNRSVLRIRSTVHSLRSFGASFVHTLRGLQRISVAVVCFLTVICILYACYCLQAGCATFRRFTPHEGLLVTLIECSTSIRTFMSP